MGDTGTGAKGFGGRNRLRNLADTSGSAPKPSGGEASTMAGSYGPKQLSDAMRVPTQDSLADAGVPGKGIDLGHGIPTQRSMYPQPDDKGAGSRSQGPEGDFGGEPGQEGKRPSIVYP